MARSSREAIDTFVAITCASEAVALRKLEEHHGDLNQAVNVYFSEKDGTNNHASLEPVRSSFMDADDTVSVGFESAPYYPSSTAGMLGYIDSLYQSVRSILEGEGFAGSTSHEPRVSHPRNPREISIEYKDEINLPSEPRIEDVTGHITEYQPTVQGTVIIDDAENIPESPVAENDRKNDRHLFVHPEPSAPQIDIITDIETEEEMIKAAIEASKREASSHPLIDHRSSLEDAELARAISLSLKTAGKERALHEQGIQIGPSGSFSPSRNNLENQGGSDASAILRSWPDEDDAEDEESPLIRHQYHQSMGNPKFEDNGGSLVNGNPLSYVPHDKHYRHHGNVFSEELGGISSQECEEAIMLEAALLGGDPKMAAHQNAYPPQNAYERNANAHIIPCMGSSTPEAERLLKKQQDDEYLAALAADKERELKAMKEVELRDLEGAATRDATQKKKLEDEEFERKLRVKQVSLPQEPSLDDENAMALLIKMPDGSRHGHRFLKSDKLQCVADFIDIGRLVEPGSYRLVRPYPHNVFGETELEMTLSELGFTNKQEALFLQLI